MTQDPWGQPRPTGWVVPGEVVQDSESGAPQAGQAQPITHFQKVASAARADQPEQPASQEDEARTDEVTAVSSPDAGRDYWDDEQDAPDEGAGDTRDATAGPADGAADSVSAPADEPETALSAPSDETAPSDEASPSDEAAPSGEAEEEMGDQAGADTHDATDPSMTQPNVFATPPATAASVPTVPIAVAEEPNGAAGRHAAPESAAVAAVPAVPVGPAVPAVPAVPAAPAAPAAEEGLRPGESGTSVGLGENGYASLIPDTADLRTQWHRIQYKFVDDPRASVTEAADVLAQVAARLEAAIAERQRGLRGRWDTAGAADTENLRETLRMYRSFLDQLIGPEPS